MRMILSIVFLFNFILNYAQDYNCNAFKLLGDLIKYEACEKYSLNEKAPYYQGTRASQELYDEVIKIDSTFAAAYREKGTPYLKRGDFITWYKLISKAVQYEPDDFLGIRASCLFSFLNDYKSTIKDIEALRKLRNSENIGYTNNGTYHLTILEGLSYKMLGNKEKAYQFIFNQLNDTEYDPSLYDYLHLGVLELELGKLNKALNSFKKQSDINDIAENQYYIAKVYFQEGKIDLAKKHINKAKTLYLSSSKMYDPYNKLVDQIYLQEIEEFINKITN